MDTLYPVERMFFEMVQRGFSLTLRDYRDTLRSIELGYGGRTREALLMLLKRLWARNEEELRALELLFEQLPLPTDEEIRHVAGERNTPARTESADDEGESLRGGRRKPRKSATPTIPQIEFAQSTETGIGIPSAIFGTEDSKDFVLSERPTIPLRSMIVAWRRFRRSRRAGPPVKLDIAACIEEQCRVGRLVRPVLVPERRNFAHLVLLVDLSPSMAALSGLVPLWRESLAEGRLGSAAVYYFRNAPREKLFGQAGLRQPVKIAEAVRRHPESALLIISDAGAARGFRSRQRVADTRSFLKTARSAWSPIAWLNPMPAARWHGSSAEEIAGWPNVSMFPLNEDGLTRAVDLLRGSRSI
jgi:hypothetical protein